MIRTTQLKGKQLKERLQKLSQPINEGVVSMVEPTKYHNRISPTSKILQTFHIKIMENHPPGNPMKMKKMKIGTLSFPL